MLDSASVAKPSRSKHGLRATAPVVSKPKPEADKAQVDKPAPALQKLRKGNAVELTDNQPKVENPKANSVKKAKAA